MSHVQSSAFALVMAVAAIPPLPSTKRTQRPRITDSQPPSNKRQRKAWPLGSVSASA